ncbi:MAG: YggT family protein [Armatimonadetes bacterium]|nr:YggT family protein [Armatimonadota bacterium]
MNLSRLIILLILDAASLLVLADVVVSWSIHLGARAIHPWDPWVKTLRNATNPLLAPFRALIPPQRTNGLDLSPMLALICIQLLQSFFSGLAL